MTKNERTVTRVPDGILSLPASKSIAGRAILCAALAAPAEEESILTGITLSDDVNMMINAVRCLGASVREEGSTLYIKGAAAFPSEAELHCMESGAALRFLLPIAAALGIRTTFVLEGRLAERPLTGLTTVLQQNGVDVSRPSGNTIRIAGTLRAGHFPVSGNETSQFISGLLLALPLCERGSAVGCETPLRSAPYIDMTIAVMERFGVRVSKAGDGFSLAERTRYRPARYSIEKDFSHAAYFLCAAALGCDVRCRSLLRDSIQGDHAILGYLRQAGATVLCEGNEITVKAARILPLQADMRDTPDLVPPLAALLCFAEGESRLTGAEHLRLKESDRLSALAIGLSALGADIEATVDGLRIRGKRKLRGGAADACGDHRIAMTLALASIGCADPVTITGAASVTKSYPDFWADFEKRERGHLPWEMSGGKIFR